MPSPHTQIQSSLFCLLAESSCGACTHSRSWACSPESRSERRWGWRGSHGAVWRQTERCLKFKHKQAFLRAAGFMSASYKSHLFLFSEEYICLKTLSSARRWNQDLPCADHHCTAKISWSSASLWTREPSLDPQELLDNRSQGQGAKGYMLIVPALRRRRLGHPGTTGWAPG